MDRLSLASTDLITLGLRYLGRYVAQCGTECYGREILAHIDTIPIREAMDHNVSGNANVIGC